MGTLSLIMEKRFEDLPNWTFWIDEVSAGVYNVKGKENVFGANLDLTGTNPEELLRQARETAFGIGLQTRRKLH